MRRLSHDQWDAEFTRLYTASHDFLFSLARGMPGRSGVTVVTMLVCFFHCTRGCGRIARPAFPAPSEFQKAERFWQTSRETRGENAKLCLRRSSHSTQDSIAIR